MKRDPGRTQVKTANIAAWAVLVFIESLQFIILVATIFSFIPIKLNDFVKTLLPLYWDQVRPERELQFYAAFVLFNILGQAAAVFFMRRQLQEQAFAKKLLPFMTVEAGWTFLQLVCVFKIFVFGHPAWAHWALYGTIVLSLLCKIFWPEVKRLAVGFYQWVESPASQVYKCRIGDIGVPVLLVFLLWPCDLEKVLAQVFAWDYFFHLDFFVMSPGWAYLNGLPIDIEASSNYNVLIPAFFGFLGKALGGFDYAHVVQGIIITVLLYYAACYFFLRVWLKSVALAAFGVLLAIKLQLFHWGIFPLVWRFPSTTPARYLFDIAVIFLVWRHAQTGRLKYLWAACAGAGVMMAYVLDAGVYLTLAFYAYAAMHLLMPHTRGHLWKSPKDTRRLLGLLFLPPLTGFVLLWMFQGMSVWQGEFWSNMTEYSRLFLSGFGTLPVTDVLKDKQFFAFVMGFIIPAVYVWTVMCVGALCFLKRMNAANTFVVFLGIYGLGLYHYFVYRSGLNSYYAVCVPFVFIICFWAAEIARYFSVPVRRAVLWSLCLLTLGALMTSYLFTVYPNCLNLARVDYDRQVQMYRQESAVAKDVDLIRNLTSADERVPLISSFETKILIEAGRKPFFYYFPLIYSMPLSGPDFKGTDILTTGRMQKTIDQLEQDKPQHVFIEKKLYGGLTTAHYQHFQTLFILVQYLSQHYDVSAKGQFLLALKRKPASTP